MPVGGRKSICCIQISNLVTETNGVPPSMVTSRRYIVLCVLSLMLQSWKWVIRMKWLQDCIQKEFRKGIRLKQNVCPIFHDILIQFWLKYHSVVNKKGGKEEPLWVATICGYYSQQSLMWLWIDEYWHLEHGERRIYAFSKHWWVIQSPSNLWSAPDLAKGTWISDILSPPLNLWDWTWTRLLSIPTQSICITLTGIIYLWSSVFISLPVSIQT